MTSIADFKDISKFELRDIIDSISNQINHLEKSQDELLLALNEEPDDEDFRVAHKENVGVLASKRQTRELYKAHLKEIDPAYYMQHYATRNESVETTTTTIAGQEVTDSSNESSAGVYL